MPYKRSVFFAFNSVSERDIFHDTLLQQKGLVRLQTEDVRIGACSMSGRSLTDAVSPSFLHRSLRV
jgi:hypothetical protein